MTNFKCLFIQDGRLRPTLRVVAAMIIIFFLAAMLIMFAGTVALLFRRGDFADFSLLFNLGFIGQGLGVILGVVIARRVLDRRPLLDLGLRPTATAWADLVFGLLLGAGLQILIFLVHLVFGWAAVIRTGLGPASPFILFGPLLVFALVALNEELLARGYILQNLEEAYGAPVAIAISSLIFGAFHLMNQHAGGVAVFNIAITGVFLAIAYKETGSLYLPIGIHLTWNFFEGPVLGFPVSGYTQWPSWISLRVTGPALWTGGPFGPEAGLLGLLAPLLGIVMIYVWKNWKTSLLPTRTSLH